MSTAQERLDAIYEAEIAAEKKGALDDIPVAGRGALTFDQVDTFLKDNPDAQFFRIANNAETASRRGSYSSNGRQLALGTTDAALISQASERNSLSRYANVSASSKFNTGVTGEIPVDIRPQTSSFFTNQRFAYDADDGLIFSREEFADIKNQVRKQSAARGDRFLEAVLKQPSGTSQSGKEATLSNPIRQPVARLGDEADTEQRTLLG